MLLRSHSLLAALALLASCGAPGAAPSGDAGDGPDADAGNLAPDAAHADTGADAAQDASADAMTTDSGPVSCLPAPPSATVVDVRTTGAKGDATTDDTAAIQAAVDRTAGTGGTTLVPDGTYMINALRGIQLKSRMTLRLSSGATLRAIPNGSTNYEVVAIRGATDVNVVGGTIEGERGAHQGKDGQWGHGLHVVASKNVVIEAVRARECWGDGIYVGGSGSSKISVCRVLAEHNRRQGMSITSADGVVVQDSTFRDTKGQEPETGLDIEPNAGETVTNVRITRCKFQNNAGGGLLIGPARQDMTTTFVTKTLVEDNVMRGNGVGALSPPNYGIQLTACTGNTIRNNEVADNAGIGIGINDTTSAVVTGNRVTGTTLAGSNVLAGAGIVLGNDKGTQCSGNTVTGNAGNGIVSWGTSDAKPAGNTVTANGKTP